MEKDAPTSSRVGSLVGSAEALRRAGFRSERVAQWFSVPSITDLALTGERAVAAGRPRTGLGAWIALLVAGERVGRAALTASELRGVYDALVSAGVVVEADGLARAAWALVPIGDVIVVCDRRDAADDARVALPDVSALNTWGCLPPSLAGRTLCDVGTGSGLLALAASKRGATVWGGDVHARAVAAAELGRALELDGAQAARCRFVVADLFGGDAPARCDLAVWNAPLLRAAVAGSEVGAASYTSAPEAEAAVLRFLEAALGRLGDDGEILLHAQLTPALDAALAEVAGAVTSLVFAWAVDGTGHALTRIRRGAPSRRRSLVVPLGVACAHLRRELLDAVDADDGAPLGAGDTVVPPGWLELRLSQRLDERGLQLLERRFGGVAIDEDDEKLLRALDGRTLGALGIGGTRLERLQTFRGRGLVIRRG